MFGDSGWDQETELFINMTFVLNELSSIRMKALQFNIVT